MGNPHRLVDRDRLPPCLVYSEGENIVCAWLQLSAQYSHSAAVTPNGLLHQITTRGVLKIETARCWYHLQTEYLLHMRIQIHNNSNTFSNTLQININMRLPLS